LGALGAQTSHTRLYLLAGGRHVSTVNAYAPFYLWRDPAGLNSFLYGPFRAITTDFGRPPVRHWMGVAFHPGPELGAAPTFATRATTRLPPDLEPGPVLDVTPHGVGTGVHSQAVAVDPARWEVVRFTLWTTPPARTASDEIAYDVLHASTPYLKDLPTGQLR
jgi:hypothetical protein